MKSTEENSLSDKNLSIYQFSELVIEITSLLLESGAHCERISRNIQRVSANSFYNVEMLMSFTAISICVSSKEDPKNTLTTIRRIKHYGTNFTVLTNTSLLTWQLADKEISLSEFVEKIRKLNDIPRYSVWIVRLFIGFACCSLSLLAGGNWIDGLFAFTAAFIGLTIRQIMVDKGFNLMVSITCASFITSTIAGMNALFSLGAYPGASVATSVLFLIPGVPLINSIIDLIEGYIPIGIARMAFAGSILLCIAVGMFISMSLIGINDF